MTACREGDALVVTKLDRLARSLPDARAIADEITARRVRLSVGGAVYDPTDPGRPAAVQRVGHGRRGRPHSAADQRGHASREGRGSAPGQATQSQPAPRSASGRVAEVGYYSTAEIGDLFGVARSTVYRAIGCEQATSPTFRRRPDPVNCGTSLAMSRYTSPTQRHLDGGPVPRWVTPKRDIATIGCRAPVDLRSGFGYRYG